MSLGRSILMLTAAFFTAVPGWGAKTDVVSFANGDRLTGEIKELDRGKLRFKTEATDTISIEWDDVARLNSSEHFDVWLESGERLYGSLSSPDDGQLEIAGSDTPRIVGLENVVQVAPIEESRREQLDGSLDVGFSYTQADGRAQLSLGAELSSRSLQYKRSIRINSLLTEQEDVEATRRADLDLALVRFLRKPKRTFYTFAQFQHNEELDIDLRSLAGLAYGFSPVLTNTSRITLFAGGAATLESFGDETPRREGVDGVLGFELENFRFDTPERWIDVGLILFPSFSQSGRVRAELRTRIRWEIIEDFYFGLTILETYDTDDRLSSSERSDFTTTTSLGWSF